MPFYDYECSNPECKKPYFEEMYGISEDSLTTQCPTCFGVANKILISAPAVHGSTKGHGGFQFHIDKPNPLEECKRDIRILEESGKMGKNESRAAKLRLAGLKRDTELGRIKKVDYQVVGHPMERD